MCFRKRNATSTTPPISNTAPTTLVPATNLATSDAEAKTRFTAWKNKDPFPTIDSSLLNSADILAYVKATSLIYPFTQEKLKGASYDVTIEGTVVYWDNEGKRQTVHLDKDGDYFELYPNAIAFVTLQPTFRIPYYLALRFNLKITHIYKGLLLGTGPLVDPGFVGRLSIPLHNLTNNTYRFFKGDELITMEFTKMSSNQSWNTSINSVGHSEAYIRNDIDADRDVSAYIAKALKKDRLGSVISSIPGAMIESRQEVQNAKNVAKRIERKANIQTTISTVAVFTLVLSAITLSINSINKANDRYDSLIAEYSIMEQEYSNKIDELNKKIEHLEDRVNLASSTDETSESYDSTEPADSP